MFKPGDKVRKKDRTLFSNGEMIATVDNKNDYGGIWLVETSTWVGRSSLEKAEEMKIEIGDTIGRVDRTGCEGVVTSFSPCGNYVRINGAKNGFYLSNAVLVKKGIKVEYEDQWHLNDGKVTIPDDADKLEKDGSVVAFRKRKITFKFGDMVKSIYSGNIYVLNGKIDSIGWLQGFGKEQTIATTLNPETVVKIDKETL